MTDSATRTKTSAGRTGVIVATACAAQFMVVLDVSVVNVALPSIRDALGFHATALQWVVNAYALMFAGFLLLGGRLADIYGLKRVFLAGLALFSASSLIGGIAGSPELLIIARAAQGLGAAVLAPASLTLITTSIPEGSRRTRALAMWTAVGIAGGSAGNLVGGLLTQYLSWRWVLLINVPVGGAAIALAAIVLTIRSDSAHTRRVDVPGAVLATIGFASLTYAISESQHSAWPTPATIALLAAAVAALIAFWCVERRASSSALIPLRLFRVRAISAGNIVMVLAGAALMPMWYFLSLYMQEVMGYGALKTGLGFLPHTAGTIVVAARITPWLMGRIPARTLVIVGALVGSAGFYWQSLIEPQSGYLAGILGPAVAIAVGGGLLNTPITTTVLSGADESDAGAASGLMNTAKQVGGAVGLAAIASVTVGAGAVSATYTHAFALIAVVLGAVAIAAFALPSGGETQSQD